MLINLNPLDSYCGGTEVWFDKLKRGDLVSVIMCDVYAYNFIKFELCEMNYGYSDECLYCYANLTNNYLALHN